jgi:hypothetical protein
VHDRVRDRARREARDAGTGRRRRLDAFFGDGAEEFADQERNAAGHLVARGREGGLHVGAERQPHEFGHRVLAQRREYQDLGRRLGGEGRKHRRTVRRLGGPRGGDDRDRQFLQPSPQIVQKAQRGLVSPVGIVDAQQHRAALAEVRAQPVQPVQDRERGVKQRAGNILLHRRDAEQRRRAPGRAR